jgi:hypothetical protein
MSTLQFIFEYGALIFAGAAITLGCLKIFKKVKSGDINGAKADAHVVADKIVDILVDVIERMNIKEVKTNIALEVGKDKEVESALNAKLESRGYLSRKDSRGN